MKKIILVPALLVLALSCKNEAAIATDVSTQSVSQDAAGAGAEPQETHAPVRMIVRTANMRILVDDTSKAVDAVTKSVEAMGGYVSDSNVWREGELLRARVTLRVPSDKLTTTLASIRGVARRVENESLASEDVSAEFVDLEARLRNLEATEEELRQLLVVARQNSRKAADVLEVHQQLTQIRGQIEQTRGRMRHLSQVTAMSAIALEVGTEAVLPSWHPASVMRDASRALVGVLQSMATAAIWLVIYVVPMFGMLALLIAAFWKIARRLRAREA
ncbi:MAG TPA: DUF4349 domain-containing protein [Thermoanaerobaculia bacterium]|nr:DUF4349 domain-containing protein [Thermoanaerobaculia bacterium]